MTLVSGPVGALRRSSSIATLRAEVLRPLISRFGLEVHRQAEELCNSMNADAAAQKAKLEQTLKSLLGGDVRPGQLDFNGPKAGCSACHAIGYLGGQVGPDLSRIAQIRTERDILESILYPSASFAQLRARRRRNETGQDHQRVLRNESVTEVVLAIGANKVVRIPRNDIDEIRPGTFSVMPSGLDQLLTREQLSDLLAFLKACQ